MKHRSLSFIVRLDRFLSSFTTVLAITLISSLLVTGCSSTPEKTVAFTPLPFEPEKTIIYIYRTSRFIGAANDAEIFINNNHICKLDNGSYCTYITEPGAIEVKAFEELPAIFVLRNVISKLVGKQPLIDFIAAPGQEYFLEFNVAGYKVKQVGKAYALSRMGGLEPGGPPRQIEAEAKAE